MTKLSEIERQAYLKKIRTWHEQRGMDIEHQILTEPVMRYIERLEAALQAIANNTCCSTCQEAKLVAQKALAQHKREAAR